MSRGRKNRVTTPKKRLPNNCKWAIEDAMSAVHAGEHLLVKLHQETIDPSVLHKLMEIKVQFEKAKQHISSIGLERE